MRTLRQHGEAAVLAALEAAIPYPIEGVQRVGAGTLERLFHLPPLPVLTIGVGATETEYIGRSLQKLKAFAYRHGCNVWVVVHPTKLVPAKPGAKLAPPLLYDVAGSAHWANKADLALTIHTPEHVTEVHLRKARLSRWGRRNTMASLEFDPTTGRYSSASFQSAFSDGEVP